MRLRGIVTLPNDFTWTPNQLLSMIKEIDKICPEEGLPNTPIIDQRQQTGENGSNS
jgi:hypothetical protein